MTALRYSNTGWNASTPGVIPSDLPDLALWLDADDPSTFTYSSGVVVSQWDDKSINGYDMTQPFVAIQPSRSGVMNGRPSVVFADDLMSAASNVPWQFMHDGTGYTVFIVGTVDNAGALFPAFAGTTSTWSAGPGFDILCQRATTMIRHGITATAADVQVVDNLVTGVVPFATPFLVTISSLASEPVAADRSTLRFVRTDYRLNVGTAAPLVVAPASALTIGGRQSADAGTRLSGQIAEFIVYRRRLPASERASITNYLAAKWAV